MLRAGANILQSAKIDNHFFEARLLLQHVLGCGFESLMADADKYLDEKTQQHYFALITRRSNHEPFAYIVGRREFYGLDFVVNNNVLIPRSDSETLVDAVLHDFAPTTNKVKILDIGTGSGCLVMSLLTHLPNAQGIAIDINHLSLEVAKENAVNLKLANRISFLQSDCFANLDQEKFDIIISNPPYIAYSERPNLSAQVLNEPEIALFADKQGLAVYEKIAQKAKDYLSIAGVVYLEIGLEQEKQIEQIFTTNGFIAAKKYHDLNGIIRCLKFRQYQDLF